MRFLFPVLILLLIAGCSNDITEPVEANAPAITEMWVIVDADGTETTYNSEPELWDSNILARPDGSQATCWHWTFDMGTWWVRHCGYTLSQECFYFSSPTGTYEPCNGMGPGGNW